MRADDERARFTLEVRRSNPSRSTSTSARDSGGRRAPALLPGQRRGRDRDVAHAGDPRGHARGRPNPGRYAILAIETSCDDTCAAVIGARGGSTSNVISSQGVHERFGGSSRDRLAPSPRVGQPDRRAGARRPARPSTTSSSSGPRRGRDWSARCSSASRRQGARRRAELPFAPVDHLQGHVAANFLSRREDGLGGGRVRAAIPLPDRQRRPHAAGRGHASTTGSRCSAARSTTPPERRSTRARGCSGCGYPGRRRPASASAGDDRRRSPSRAPLGLSRRTRAGGRLRQGWTSPSPG